MQLAHRIVPDDLTGKPVIALLRFHLEEMHRWSPAGSVHAARSRRLTWVGLETGRTEPLRPAVVLYRKHGFTPCPPFADYVSDDFSQCVELTLPG